MCSIQFFDCKLFQSIPFCLYLCRAWLPSWQMSSFNNSSGCKKQQHIAHKKVRSQSWWFWAFQITNHWARDYTHAYYHNRERHSWLSWSRVRIMFKFFMKVVFLLSQNKQFFSLTKTTNFMCADTKNLECLQTKVMCIHLELCWWRF